MASGLLIKQKQLLAGDGIAINHGETASTISLAENALDNAVRIYDATVEAETGVITITDGTPVADLAIGDEIRTPDGVYQKIKDNTTTTGPADGSRIEVSGITSPADANGYYALQSENLWKHETANYWITLFSGRYWMISDKSAPASPGECIFFVTITGLEVVKPWEIDTSWEPMNESVGDPQVENVGALTTVANTIDLFEYASLPIEPENIVQSVNGNKPDASGNVTIETGSGGLTSVSVGNGLTGNGTSSNPIKLDLSTAVMDYDCDINAQGHTFTVYQLNEVEISATSIILGSDSFSVVAGNNISIFTEEDSLCIDASQILLNRHGQNTAGGLAVVGSNGKLPSSILPESTVDLSNYTGALNITATSNASIRGGTSGNYDVTIGDSSHGVTVYAAQNNPTVSITSFGSSGNIDLNSANINVGGSSGSTKITLKSSNVSVEPTTGGGTFSVDVTSSGSVKFTAGNIYFNNNASNTAGGFAIVGSDGKLPASIIPVSGNRHPFTSSDLSSNVLTITTTGNVTGVIDDSGKAWNFADEEVTYTDSTVSVDLSGVFARKGIATPTGTWKLMLYGA